MRVLAGCTLVLVVSGAGALGCGDNDDDDDDHGLDDGGTGGEDGGGGGDGGDAPDAALGDVTVEPVRIDDVLTNPNMGFADFHFGWWCNLPPVDFTPGECADRAGSNLPDNHPRPGVAYFRWLWRDLEPVRGEIDFGLIDTAIQSANQLGETLGFRVMMIDEGGAGVPDWLRAAPYDVAGPTIGGTFWPDVRDPSFAAEHERFVSALGARYDDHPGLDHVDIGSVGCWGEWNTACLPDGAGIIDVYGPANDAERDEIAAALESAWSGSRMSPGTHSSPGARSDALCLLHEGVGRIAPRRQRRRLRRRRSRRVRRGRARWRGAGM